MPQEAAVTTPSACSISAVERRSIFQSKPRPATRRAALPARQSSAVCRWRQAGRRWWTAVPRRGLNHLGVVLAQALDHQLEPGFGAELAAADVGAGQRRVGLCPHRGVLAAIQGAARMLSGSAAGIGEERSFGLLVRLGAALLPTTHGRSGWAGRADRGSASTFRRRWAVNESTRPCG
jgi:hypothetical protein